MGISRGWGQWALKQTSILEAKGKYEFLEKAVRRG